MSDRLFVPLKSQHYWAFESSEKTWELRGLNHQFNESTVVPGRRVELRRGYSTDNSLWGVIEAVETFESVDSISDVVPYELIRPGATEDEFVASVHELLGKYDSFIAFHVAVDSV